MPITIEGPDGTEVEFPDGTDPSVMRDAMRKHFRWKAPPEPSTFDYVSGLAQKAAQGATFNFGDEIAAGAGAVGNAVARGLGMDIPERTYRGIKDEIAAGERQFTQANPKAAMAASIAGGLGSAVALGPVGLIERGAAAIPTLVGRGAARGAMYGAPMGAVSAVGEGGLADAPRGALEGGVIGGIAGGAIGPALSEVVVPAVTRTVSGLRSAISYGNQAVANARNPAQAAIENVVDRSAASGVDLMAMRATALADERGRPLLSPALRARGIDEEGLADIISRSMRGEPAAQIGQAHGISAQTVTNYATRYREANPTPMNFIDLAKEQVGQGAAGPLTRLGRAANSLAGDEAAEPAQRLIGRQEGQAGRSRGIIERSVAGGDFEATRRAGLQNLRDEAGRVYKTFYAEPDLATTQLADLMEDPLFRLANVQAQRQARVEAIRRNQAASRTGGSQEAVPTVAEDNQVFSPEMLDHIQRQLRITAQGSVSNPNAAAHARNLREVFLDRIEDHYPTFRGIRRDYATGMGEFGEEGALEAGAALTAKLGAPSREALRGFDDYTTAQQELFRLGFARNLMDLASNKQTGAAVANQFNTPAVREIVERLYPRSDTRLYREGQRMLRDLRRETITTSTKNDVLAGSQTAEKSHDMGQMMEGAKAAADVATGKWGKVLDNLSTRLSNQIGRRGAGEVLQLLTLTEPAQVLPMLNRLAAAAQTRQQRQAYAMAILQIRSMGTNRIPGVTGGVAGANAGGEERRR